MANTDAVVLSLFERVNTKFISNYVLNLAFLQLGEIGESALHSLLGGFTYPLTLNFYIAPLLLPPRLLNQFHPMYSYSLCSDGTARFIFVNST
jgi:hypothetical protein